MFTLICALQYCEQEEALRCYYLSKFWTIASNANLRQIEVGEGAIFTWSSCEIHGLRLLHDTCAPPLTSFPLTSLKLQYSQVLNSHLLRNIHFLVNKDY